MLGTNGGSLWLWCCLPQPGALGPGFSVVGRNLQRLPILQALLQSHYLRLPPAGHKLSVLPLFSPDTFPSILPAPAPEPLSFLKTWRSWNETSFHWAPFDLVPHFSLLPVVFMLLSGCEHHTGRACILTVSVFSASGISPSSRQVMSDCCFSVARSCLTF